MSEPSDAGQAALKAANDDDTDALYNFEIEFSSGRKKRFKARVMSFTVPIGAVQNLVEFRSKIVIQGAITDIAP